jgi:multimeric flavodoxin WrbA
MKVLGISGSPRKDGNTELMVKKALEACRQAGAETSYIALSEKEINYCRGCYSCRNNPRHECVQEDDAAAILAEMRSADAIIIGSPTYFAQVSGKLKSLFDRTLPLRMNGFLLSGKVGGALAVGGSRNGGQESVCGNIQNWMLVHDMLVVSDEKTSHFGGICVGRNPGDVLSDADGLRTVENLAKRVCSVAKKITKGK